MVISISIETATNPTLGISIGLSIRTDAGMMIGMMHTAREDLEAEI